MSKPAHLVVRNPENIRFFAKNDPYLTKDWIKRGNSDPTLLNVITSGDGRILYVDAREGHHRFMGALLAGRKTLGELEPSRVKILINGRASDGTTMKANPPAAGVDFRNEHLWKTIDGKPYLMPSRGDSRFVDVWMNASVPHWDQGAVMSLGDVMPLNINGQNFSVGVMRLSKTEPDPRKFSSMAAQGFQEILIVPQNGAAIPALNEKILSWNKSLREQGLPVRINLYVADAQGYINRFGDDSFLRRVQQIYATLSPPRYVDPNGQIAPIMPLGYEPPISP